MTTTRTTRIFAGLLALAGCQPPSAGTFGADYEAALCEWATECSVFETREQCREALVWDSIGRFEYLERAVAAGRARFSGDAASGCIEAISQLGCEKQPLTSVLFDVGFSAAPAICRDVYVGLVRNYDPCFSSEECAGETAVCGQQPACADMCCVGACRVITSNVPKLGEPCTGPCEAGSFCAFDPNTGQSTVCTKSRGEGADCLDDSSACDVGLDCVYEDSVDVLVATCKPRLKAGELCDYGRCEDGLDCYSLNDERRCRTPPDEGDACDTNNYPACARVDNACDGGTCVKLPGPGEACPGYACLPSAECRDSNGDGSYSCVARGGLGANCGPDQYISCLGHLRCDESNRCAEPESEPVCEVPK